MQNLAPWTLLGEYCGVIKTDRVLEAESAECSIGFGGLMNDKIKDFCHSKQGKPVNGELCHHSKASARHKSIVTCLC